MGSNQSSDKLYCNRYLDGQGPPSLVEQATEQANGKFSTLSGCQPDGKMTWEVINRDLAGFPNDNTLKINFSFLEGKQTKMHPHPGQNYAGGVLCAYLPDNHEGKKVLALLEKAFNQKLLFRIATNEDGEDVITTSSIPLKIQSEGGNIFDGPDADYLKTVKKLLNNNGIK
ncbi:E3 ubiquitin-protein ligase DTX3L1 [Simochromis diagramma]|uniref:E3 ubiquitin-protein ligase DTX3L1 n=1 Tax=Simochromis diagramma TaxID=43689 RepID=UPI001A7EA4CF|nr:E3 ubiquitin-protein ligase DTX3L1 [Simochromis diagramma]